MPEIQTLGSALPGTVVASGSLITPAGDQGLTGAAGADSTVPGPQGPIGNTGAPGPQGPIGNTGPAGADSTVPGPTGPQGPIGNTGPQGPIGNTGPQGPIGNTGAQGPQGVPGVGPTGTIVPFAGSAAPTGWLLCDGTAPSRTTEAALFAVIGTTYGAGDGSTTFNLPDGRGRTLIGVGQGTGLTNRALAAVGGEESHVLTVPELAVHTHIQNAHAHNILTTPTPYATGSNAGNVATSPASGQVAGQGATAVNQNTGGNAAHNTMPPFLAVNFIIKN